MTSNETPDQIRARAGVSSVKVGGNGRSMISINMLYTKFFIYVAIFIITLTGTIWGVISVAADWMTEVSDRHINQNIMESIEPPSGVILKAIRAEIEAQTNETWIEINDKLDVINDRIEFSERQQIRSDFMLSEVFQKATGRQPPPVIK